MKKKQKEGIRVGFGPTTYGLYQAKRIAAGALVGHSYVALPTELPDPHKQDLYFVIPIQILELLLRSQ